MTIATATGQTADYVRRRRLLRVPTSTTATCFSATRGRAPPNAMPEAEAETATETLFGDARTCACFVTRRRIHVCGGQRTQQAHASNHSIVIGMCPALRRTDIGVVMEQARYSGDATAVCDGDQHTTSDVAAWWCLGSNQRHAHYYGDDGHEQRRRLQGGLRRDRAIADLV